MSYIFFIVDIFVIFLVLLFRFPCHLYLLFNRVSNQLPSIHLYLLLLLKAHGSVRFRLEELLTSSVDLLREFEILRKKKMDSSPSSSSSSSPSSPSSLVENIYIKVTEKYFRLLH